MKKQRNKVARRRKTSRRIALSLTATGIVSSIVGTALGAGGDANPVGLATIEPVPEPAISTQAPIAVPWSTADFDTILYVKADLPGGDTSPQIVPPALPTALELPPVVEPAPVLQLPDPVTGRWPPDEKWARLRMCESTDDPRAVSSDGWYRGLYQFDMRTWRSVGGWGDPIDASREEQHYRALLLYAARGAQPWPVCGRYLF